MRRCAGLWRTSCPGCSPPPRRWPLLDVLCSFAVVSVKNDYTRPVINMSGKLYLKDSRHPVVEALLHDTPFVPNDVDMDMHDNRVAIITGPNMAGKSTYMRQIALIAIMAQIGCFVPAAVAEIGIVDSIFTRVGASDDLSAGQSTFMVEMSGGGGHSAKRHPKQPVHPRRNRPRHLHLRRHEHCPGRVGVRRTIRSCWAPRRCLPPITTS